MKIVVCVVGAGLLVVAGIFISGIYATYSAVKFITERDRY